MQVHESNVTLSSATKIVTTTLSSKLYNEKYSLIEVYTNGLKEPQTAYTTSLSGGVIVITFNTSKASGTAVTVKLDNFLDGEGMSTVLDQYNSLVQEVANLKTASTYNYICNGKDDNVKISEIAQAFNNNTSLPTNAQLTINVYGNLDLSKSLAASNHFGITKNNL